MLKVFRDITGQRFGRLVVIKVSTKHSPSGLRTTWLCKCDCGNEKIIRGDCLGKVNSCGCIKREQDLINLTANHSHKMAGTRLYRKWQDMKNRCYNPKVHRFELYGGRGISVCSEWIPRFEPFRDWALANGYTDKLSIDRINNDGNYEPSNCRWVDNKTQCNNRKTTHLITYNGKTQSIMQWSEELGINYGTLKSRIKRGAMSPDRIFIV